MNRVQAFGERAAAAQRYYRPDERPLVIVSPDGAVDAMRACVAWREAGILFDGAFLLDDPKTAQARIAGGQILRASPDFDNRRNAFELLARGPVAVNGALAEAVLKTLADCAALCERYRVHSWREYRRVTSMLGMSRPPRLLPAVDEEIPGVRPAPDADAVVVWAPGALPEELGAILLALEELHRPAYVVAKPGPVYGLKTIVVARENAARALTRAAVVIDANPDVPCALSFAKRGFRTVTAAPGGAAEFAPSMPAYDPWSRRSVFGAVVAALGAPPAAVHPPPPASPAPRATVSERAPLASVIVRTRDRAPGFLRRALRGIESQTYPNVEALVVNDGGDETAIAAVAAGFSRARWITVPSGGVARAATAGVRAARGKYAGFCDDDDLLFPDHVERLAGALERSGALAAFADALNISVRKAGKNFAVAGYRLVHVPAVEPSVMLWLCQIVGSSRMLFERAWVEASGPFVPGIAPADDYEVWLRLLGSDDIVPAGAVTSLYTQFMDRTNASIVQGGRYADAHRAIYAMHPTERPGIRGQRERVLRQLETDGGLRQFAPVVTLDPQPLLLESGFC